MMITILITFTIFFTLINLQILHYRQFNILGVSLKPEHANHAETKRRLKHYKTLLIFINLILSLVSFITNFPKFNDYQDIFSIILLFVIIFTDLAIIILLQRSLQRLKQNQDWTYANRKMTVDSQVVMNAGSSLLPTSWVWLAWSFSLIPLIILVINIMTKTSLEFNHFLIPSIILPLMLLLLPLSYKRSLAIEQIVLSNNAKANQMYYKTIERTRSIAYIALTFSTTIFTALLLLFVFFKFSQICFYLLLALFLLCLILIMQWSNKTEESTQNTISDKSIEFIKETSYYSKFGLYNNPDDHRIFVPKKIGMGMTLNMGRPGGKILMIATIFPLIIVLIFVIQISFSQIGYNFSEETFQIDASMYSFSLDKSDIVRINISDAPLEARRTNGYGGTAKAFGIFHTPDLGRVRLYMYNENSTYIVIKTNIPQEEWFILNRQSKEDTKELFDDLKTWWEK